MSPEYSALAGGLQGINPNSRDGQEIEIVMTVDSSKPYTIT